MMPCGLTVPERHAFDGVAGVKLMDLENSAETKNLIYTYLGAPTGKQHVIEEFI